LEPSKDVVTFNDADASSPYYADAAALYQNGIITTKQVQPSQNLSTFSTVYIAVKAAGLSELLTPILVKK
jgi:hypothetical protein